MRRAGGFRVTGPPKSLHRSKLQKSRPVCAGRLF
jgi:hypothetical protein